MSTNLISNDLVVNNMHLHYYRTGNSNASPLVLVHGFSDNGLCWPLLVRDLKAEYDVIMPDMRGHGLSARVQRGDKVDMTVDLAGMIRDLGLDHPIVAGHSMGAMVTAQLGACFPDLPHALILEDPAWWLPKPSAARAREIGEGSPLEKWIKSLNDLSLEQVIDQERAEHPTWPEVVLHKWCEAKKQLDMNFLSVLEGDWMNWQEVVSLISCPTLLITADPEKGAIITPEVMHKVTEMNSNISVAHIAGTGHHIRFENYDAYVDAVRAFLKEIGQ
jgi:pimeloyl-ACP methyl ester carboxylesterase